MDVNGSGVVRARLVEESLEFGRCSGLGQEAGVLDFGKEAFHLAGGRTRW
jgi:hypothetical protein